MARSSKSKRERRYSSAKKRVETHKTGFERTTLSIGSDVALFGLDRGGTRRVDVLPYVAGEGNPFADPGELHYERTFFVHRGVGVNGDTYVCPAKTAKKPCPICEYRSKLMRDPDADEQQIKDLAPKERQLWNVIDRDAPEKGVQLWDISYHLFGKLLDTEIRNADEDEDFESFFHLEGGKSLKLGIGEKTMGKGRPFFEVQTISFKPRSTDYDDEVLEKCHALDDLLTILDHGKLKSIFLQTAEVEAEAEEDDDDVDEDDREESKRPVRGKESDEDDEEEKVDDSDDLEVDLSVGDTVSYKGEDCEVLKVGEGGLTVILEGQKSGKIHKSVPVSDLSVDEDEEKDEPEPEPEPEPKRKSKSKPKVKDEPEPEDDDWDEDEEDEKPSGKSSKAKGKGKSEDDDKWDDWD